MRLTPREPVIPEVDGFTEANDLFGYRDFAERLANLVHNIDEPLVIVLDGPWGSGKTIFVKQWAGLLRGRGASVIHFDAFQSDHYEDAFLALSAEIHATAKKTLDGNENTTRHYLDRAKKAGIVLAPIALRVAARVSTAGLLSLEDLEAGSDSIKAAVKALENESANAMENFISERLSKASEERAVLEAFREALSEMAGKLAEQQAKGGQAFPLVLIIDELDRCRPPFALSVIERIKHLFSVPGVCFVLVAHLPQLEQVVQGAYGATIDAHTYLEKFYQIRLILPQDRNQPGRQRSTYVAYLWDALGITFREPRTGQLVQRELQALAERHDLSLRRLERVMTHVALVCATAGPRQLILAPLVAGLCVMRQSHPGLYRKARGKDLTWEEARNFLRPAEGQGEHEEWALDWWAYATGGEMSQEKVGDKPGIIAQYNVYDQKDLLPLMADYIDELVQHEAPLENQ